MGTTGRLHRGRRAVAVATFAVVLGTLVGPATPAAAHSIGAYPSQIVVQDALRGGRYLRTIGIIDDSPTPDTFTLQPTGDIAPWVTFVDAHDQTTIVTTVQAHAGPPSTLLLRIAVPATTANGTYKGVVHITSSVLGAPGSHDSGQAVRVSDEIPVGVQVTGTQKISGTLLDAFTPPQVEVGYPVRVFTVMNNTGNVEVHPSVHLSVSRGGVSMYDHTFQGDPVDPGVGPRHIETDWADTTAAPVGAYLLHVDVAFPGDGLGSRTLKVQVVPYGSLRRKGTLDALILASRPEPGGGAVVNAVVHNTGEIETRPVFHGELFLDGKLISGVTSVRMLTLAGATQTISFVVDLPKPGHYRLTGQANFDGVESPSRSLSFPVGSGSRSAVLPFLVGAGAVVLLAGLVVGISSVARRPPRPEERGPATRPARRRRRHASRSAWRRRRSTVRPRHRAANGARRRDRELTPLPAVHVPLAELD